MNKELALELTKQADAIDLKAEEAKQAMLNASNEDYDTKRKEYRDLAKQVMQLRKQALDATL